MLILYIYVFILLLMLILACRGINISVKFAPRKIKVLSVIVFIMILLRGSVLLIMFFSQNIIFLYLLKPFVFLYLLYIPVIAIICLYIFIRNDKIKFSYSFVVSSILSVIYMLIMYKVPVVTKSLPSYGYSMSIFNNVYVLFGFVGISTLIIIFSIIELGKPIVNNLGVFLILLCSVFSVADIFLSTFGVLYLNQNILGEFLFIGTFNYALLRLKK